MLKSMHEQVIAESVVASIDSALDLIKRAYEQTTDEVIKRQLRQQWGALFNTLRQAQAKAREAIDDDGE